MSRKKRAQARTEVRIVRIAVESSSRAAWVRQRLFQEGFGKCTVEEVGRPFGRNLTLRALWVTMPTQAQVRKIAQKGVYLGSRPTVRGKKPNNEFLL